MEGFFEGLWDVNEAMFWNYNHILDVFAPWVGAASFFPLNSTIPGGTCPRVSGALRDVSALCTPGNGWVVFIRK